MTTSPMFASDNAAGVHPAVLAALAEANRGHALGYGADDYTARANQAFKRLFGEQAESFLVFNGTGANVIALKGLLRSYEAVFCSAESHLWIDEAGAPEQFLGAKLITLPADNGKIRLDDMLPRLGDIGFQHRSQPRVISIAQCTERGSVYRRDELQAICDFARRHGFYVHIDGARIHNAVAALGGDCKRLFTDIGVDVVSFGGTKNGLMMGEAVVVLNPELQAHYAVIRKHGMQLASKMRFLAAQFLAYFDQDLWLHNAAHANRMAACLAEQLHTVPGARLMAPAETNMLFVEIPNAWIAPLQQQAYFHVWRADSRPGHSEVRLVMSFDVTQADIEAFIGKMRRLAAG